jgi:hypothetical protein
VQSLLGGTVSEAATARISLLDTAGVSHVVATLPATCATAGAVDPLVLLCARDSVLDYFKQAGAHICRRDGYVGVAEVAVRTHAI